MTARLFLSSKVIFGRKKVFRPLFLIRNVSQDHEVMAHVSGTEEAVLETLKFVNRAIKSLPVDENPDNYVRTVPGMVNK